MHVRFRLWSQSGRLWCFLPRTSAASDCASPLKGRLIRAFLRALVGAFKAGRTFVPRTTGFRRGVIGPDRSLEVETHLQQRSLALAASRHSHRRMPPCEWRGSTFNVCRAVMDQTRKPHCRYFDTVWAGGGSMPHHGTVAAADSPQLLPNSARPMTDSERKTLECRPAMPNLSRTTSAAEYG